MIEWLVDDCTGLTDVVIRSLHLFVPGYANRRVPLIYLYITY